MENQISTIDNKWVRKFFPIWGAQIFSLLGSGLVQFALVWYITQKTGSAAMLSLATLAALLPEVLLAPFAGALVDRFNRRYVMIIADGVIALFTVGLALLFAFNLIQIWHIFVVMFLRALGGIFHWPAMQASTALMVPDKHLARIAGVNQALRGGLNIIAPPLGALLMSLLQFYQVISVDVITAIIAITPLLFIRIPQPVRNDAVEMVTPKTVVRDVAEGFRYLKNWRGMLYLALIAAILNFMLAPAGTLLPLMVTEHFQKGVWELSLIESVMGIGIVAGGLTLGVWGGFKNKMVTSLVGVVGIGLGDFLFGMSPSNLFWMGAVSAGILGFMNPIANGPLMAIMQSKIAPEMQGRVLGMTNSLCAMMMPLALLISAPVAEYMGLRLWYWLGGLLTMLIGSCAFLIPSIANLDKAQSEARAEPAVE
jgi:DHA3 family macrolide efflux protein-like MFS transporter